MKISIHVQPRGTNFPRDTIPPGRTLSRPRDQSADKRNMLTEGEACYEESEQHDMKKRSQSNARSSRRYVRVAKKGTKNATEVILGVSLVLPGELLYGV